jgi:hypothetical protein
MTGGLSVPASGICAVPIHDWTRVTAGIFHDFHLGWILALKQVLNGGFLPPGYYAMAEQIAGGTGPEARAVVVRHTSNHEVIALIELVSPGNKASRATLSSFARKAQEALEAGIHLLIVDVFPPGPRDPHGIHRVIWEEGREGDFALPADAPLTCVAYMGGPCPEVFLEPVAVAGPLPEMPLFLTTETYVPVPLEATYQAAWEAVPAYWRDVLSAPVSR